MRTSHIGMGCLLLLLMMNLPSFLGGSQALELQAHDLSTEVRQGETLLFHLRGEPNETVVLHANRLGPAGQTITVVLGDVRLDANGTAEVAFPATGELGTVGTWELVAANETTFVKVRYRVDWDPNFLLNKEAANLARMEALWAEIKWIVISLAAVLLVAWGVLRGWHEWSHVRPTFLGQKLGSIFGRLGGIASVTDMGIKMATEHPTLTGRAAFRHYGSLHRRHRRVTLEHLEQALAHAREADEAAEMQEIHRRRVLQNVPDDPMVRDFTRPESLEEAVRTELKELGYELEGESDGVR